MRTTLLAIAAASLANPSLAQEMRELDAHVHGVSTAEIAVEHGIIAINIHSPGMDIVGFEYEASTPKDKDAVEAAIRQFLTPEEILLLPEAAECRLAEVLAHLHSGEHNHADDHDDHDDHDEEHDDGHDEEDDHAHDGDDHEKGAEHSEFHARYIFACDNEDALTTIGFPFFEQFEQAQEIEVQYVTETGAGTAELTRNAMDLTFE